MLFRQYDDILDLKQFMEYLNVGRTTAYKLLKSGEINVFRIGKVYKIPRKSVDEFIETKRHKKWEAQELITTLELLFLFRKTAGHIFRPPAKCSCRWASSRVRERRESRCQMIKFGFVAENFRVIATSKSFNLMKIFSQKWARIFQYGRQVFWCTGKCEWIYSELPQNIYKLVPFVARNAAVILTENFFGKSNVARLIYALKYRL